MRNYCRVYHTSLEHLSSLPLAQLIDELGDAAEDLAIEAREREKSLEKSKAKAKARSRSRPRRRR